jgi:hypothetical protein
MPRKLKLTKTVCFWISILIQFSFLAHGQTTSVLEPKPLEEELERIMVRALGSSRDYKDCGEFPTIIFSTFITTNQTGDVDGVFISNTDDHCLFVKSDLFKENLKKGVSRVLVNHDEKFPNQVFIFSTFLLGNKEVELFLGGDVLPSFKQMLENRKSNGLHEIIPQTWLDIYSGINPDALKGKSIAKLIPVQLWYFWTEKN